MSPSSSPYTKVFNRLALPALMKVALFTETYDNTDGVTTTIRQLERYLESHGHEIIVVTHAGQKSRHDGYARVTRLRASLPIYISGGYPIDLLPPLARAREVIRKEKPDVIHTISPGSCGIAGWYCAKKEHIPLVSSFHTLVSQYGRYHMRGRVSDLFSDGVGSAFDDFSGRLFERLVWEGHFAYYSRCDRVLVPNQDFVPSFERRLKKKVFLFERGVDANFYTPEKRVDLRAELGIGDVPLLLYAGRVVVEKDLDILAQAFERLEGHLVIAGDGEYMPKLRKMIRERVSFLGFVSPERLSQVYASCDIFVFPSTTDTIGNAVLEAQASGLPVVVSDGGGPKRIMVEGRTGLVARARDASDFALKVNVLLENRELRERMGSEARAYAEGKSWDGVFDALISIYEGVL